MFQVCILLTMAVPLFAQKITLDQKVSMLALGDSYTIGERVDMQERWPHQFAAALRKEGLEVRDPDYIATTGWTTSDLLKGMSGRLNREKEYNLVSILIGVNNQYQGLDMDLYEPELRQIIEQALDIAGGLPSRVFMLSIPDYAYTPFGKGDPGISREIDAYNAVKERVAGKYGITFIDITPISRQGLSQPGLVAGDGLHPSGTQYGAWVKKLLVEVKIPSQ
jgi:lysophospholipase L1-like esterase